MNNVSFFLAFFRETKKLPTYACANIMKKTNIFLFVIENFMYMIDKRYLIMSFLGKSYPSCVLSFVAFFKLKVQIKLFYISFFLKKKTNKKKQQQNFITSGSTY